MSGREATEAAEKERAGSSSTSHEGRTESGEGESMESRSLSTGRESFLFFEDDVLKASCPGSSGSGSEGLEGKTKTTTGGRGTDDGGGGGGIAGERERRESERTTAKAMGSQARVVLHLETKTNKARPFGDTFSAGKRRGREGGEESSTVIFFRLIFQSTNQKRAQILASGLEAGQAVTRWGFLNNWNLVHCW